jgi:hypothetical protein
MNEPIMPSKPPRWRAFLLLALVFGLGLVFGVGGSVLTLRRIAQRSLSGDGVAATRVDHMLKKIEKDISRELKLTDAEQQRLHDELVQASKDYKLVRADFLKQIKNIAAQAIERTAHQLPAEKSSALRTHVNKRLSRWGVPEASPGTTPAEK